MAAEDQNGEVVSTQEECTDCDTSASENSFDELARGLASGTISRGRALRMIGGALVGASLASIPAAAWAACKPLARKCTANFQCCSRNCIKNPQGNGKICGCPTGKTLCGGRCVTNCTAPKILNTSTCSCQCPANVACTGSGGTVNPSTCECECPGGKSLCGGQCVEVCSPPKVLNTDCQCECPPGTTLCRGSCVSNACGTGQFLNPATCQCAPQVCTTVCGFSSGFPQCGPEDPVTGLACFCQALAEGGCGCARSRSCEGIPRCNSSADCPVGSFCVVDNRGCGTAEGGGLCLEFCT